MVLKPLKAGWSLSKTESTTHPPNPSLVLGFFMLGCNDSGEGLNAVCWDILINIGHAQSIEIIHALCFH